MDKNVQGILPTGSRCNICVYLLGVCCIIHLQTDNRWVIDFLSHALVELCPNPKTDNGARALFFFPIENTHCYQVIHIICMEYYMLMYLAVQFEETPCQKLEFRQKLRLPTRAGKSVLEMVAGVYKFLHRFFCVVMYAMHMGFFTAVCIYPFSCISLTPLLTLEARGEESVSSSCCS